MHKNKGKMCPNIQVRLLFITCIILLQINSFLRPVLRHTSSSLCYQEITASLTIPTDTHNWSFSGLYFDGVSEGMSLGFSFVFHILPVMKNKLFYFVAYVIFMRTCLFCRSLYQHVENAMFLFFWHHPHPTHFTKTNLHNSSYSKLS